VVRKLRAALAEAFGLQEKCGGLSSPTVSDRSITLALGRDLELSSHFISVTSANHTEQVLRVLRVLAFVPSLPYDHYSVPPAGDRGSC